jgi:hypothetical protein
LTTLDFERLIVGMNYFLFCVEKPKNAKETNEWQFWNKVSDAIGIITKPIRGVQRPCENVWLIPAAKGVNALAECIQTCHSQGQKYQMFFVQMESEPNEANPSQSTP